MFEHLQNQNSKFEYRNPKQTQITKKQQYPKRRDYGSSRFYLNLSF